MNIKSFCKYTCIFIAYSYLFFLSWTGSTSLITDNKAYLEYNCNNIYELAVLYNLIINTIIVLTVVFLYCNTNNSCLRNIINKIEK